MENVAPSPVRALAANGARDDEDEVCLQAQELMFAYNVSLVLRAAIQLGLLDVLCAAPAALTAVELAEQTQAADKAEAAASVDRILGYLACFNVVRCSTETVGPDGTVLRRYTPAPVCQWPTKNNDMGSLGPFAVFLGDPDHILPCRRGGFRWAVVVREDPRDAVLRLAGEESAAGNAVRNKMLQRFKGLDDIRQLVDVGGGTGKTLEMITSRYKHIRGINFDLPHVISQAPSLPGVEHVAGNMYESVPTGDAVLLQWILLMQTDEQCIKILKNCYNALPEGGKVIVIDGLLPETPNATYPAARDEFTLDMCMFVLFKGKERTEREFAKLARESGFTGAVRSTYIFLNFYAIEFTK